MSIRLFIFVSITLLCLFAYSEKAYAWTIFGNIRGNCLDRRYYNVNGYTPAFVGYEDIYNYPYTYKLPWNRCFNYCTCYPKPCCKSTHYRGGR